MKKTETKKTNDVDNLMIDFATLCTDLKDFAAEMKDPSYAEFVTRIAAVVEMHSNRFIGFAKAAGLTK